MCGCVREELVNAFAVGFFSLVKAMADNVFIRVFFFFFFPFDPPIIHSSMHTSH